MFKILEKYKELNPIRSHIALNFKKVKEEEILKHITDKIEENLNIEESRAIIFCKSRKITEKNAAKTNSILGENPDLKDKAGFYHAGMDADSRARTFKLYKEGHLIILFCTKAFGMGMDIPNIHHVFHFEPSSSFEDYLQEVGRAGRDSKSLNRAGFSEDNPINAICYYTNDSFSKTMDWMQKNQSSWNDISNAFIAFKEYRRRFFNNKALNKKNSSLPMPINIIAKSEKYKDSTTDLNMLFRLSLYWLEMAGRIKTKNYTPAYLEFKNDEFFDTNKSDEIYDDELKSLYNYIYNKKINYFNTENSTLIDGNELIKELKIVNREVLFNLILKAQKKDILKLINEVKMNITNVGEHEVNINKLKPTKDLQYLKCIHLIGDRIIDSIAVYQKTEIDLDDLNNIANEVVKEVLLEEFIQNLNLEPTEKSIAKKYLTVNKINEEKKNEEKKNEEKKNEEKFKKGINAIKNNKKDVFLLLQIQRKILKYKWYASKIKVAFNLINQNDHVLCTSTFAENKNEIIQQVLLKEDKKIIKNDINTIYRDTIKLFCELEKYPSKLIDINELILKLDIEIKSYRYVEKLFILLKKLGYIKLDGGLVPMAIVMNFINLEEIGNQDGDENLKNEYQETLKLKKLRLLTLQTFTKVEIKTEQERFIHDYFNKSSSEEVVSLIEEFSLNADDLLKGIREEALMQEVEKLNKEQEKVYLSNIRKNTSVLAGPGTGKTHTLVLKVAKLIQKDNITPKKILILAYNRSVVEELKIRLKKLFHELGYNSLINSLQVYTFHGLIGSILHHNNIDTKNIKEWEDKFLKIHHDRGRKILKYFGDVEYVFIDEFQDITPKRLKILETIAPKKKVFITAIGDPNQSIYGYERAKEDGSRSPEPYYDMFNELYNPKIFKLKTNYRSSQKIIDHSLSILPEDSIKIPVESNKEKPKYSEDSSRVKEMEAGVWIKSLKYLLSKEDCKEVAIMFRTNEELYKEYSNIKDMVEANNFDIKIIGSSFNYTKQREIAFVIDMIEKYKNDTEINDHLYLENYIKLVKNHYPNWNFQLLDDLVLLLQFFINNKNANTITYADFIAFINELTKKDDGQLFNLLKKSYGNAFKKQVILTTIHKVKGLEFQNVIVPSSVAKLPFETEDIKYEKEELKEIYDEERRLLYVAYSRAEQNLFYEKGEREKSIISLQDFTINEDNKGVPIKNGGNNVYISWKAQINNHYQGNDFEEVHNYINKKLKIGQSVLIRRVGNKYYLGININQYFLKLEQFSSRIAYKLNAQNYSGIFVDSITRYTHEESLFYDEKHGTNYTKNWSEFAKEKGYIYLINFYGYAIEI